MKQVFLNEYASRIDGILTETGDSITVLDQMPILAPKYFYVLTLFDLAESKEPEIIKLTETSDGFTFKVERGLDGTTPQLWASGSPIEMRITAYTMTELQTAIRKNKLNRMLDL